MMKYRLILTHPFEDDGPEMISVVVDGLDGIEEWVEMAVRYGLDIAVHTVREADHGQKEQR